MKLLRAEIKNFRSVSDLKIDFEPNCRILIGINESGKSNILRALHLLDPNVNVQPSDLRMERMDEEQVAKGWVRFVFGFQGEELEELSNSLTSIFEGTSLAAPLFEANGKATSADQWIFDHHQGLYVVTLPDGKRSSTGWGAPQSLKLIPGWVRNKSTTPFEILRDGTKIVVPQEGFAFLGEVTEALSDPLEPATAAHFYSALSARAGLLVAKNLPECIFWKYSDQYLLPTSVDVTNFCNNPNTCVPLKSMFELAGYDTDTLLATITKARQQGPYRYTQILEKTANAATEHIRRIWKDYSTVRFRLEPNGEILAPMVSDDHVPLDMANRSDGFKRFVSFLLQISAKVRTAELSGALVLIDEPEIALHPSGCRDLLRELIQIGETNAIAFSTHSIFMVDKENIERHLVVEKKNEITTTWRAEKSRVQDEEVLYSAMGYSVFETLKPKNVIFEGWRDKYIFQIMRDSMTRADSGLKARMQLIGSTHANGVKDIRNVARFMELASRPCLILSDADTPALQHKRQYEEPTAWAKWKTLQDVFGASSFVTAEDLLTAVAIAKRANKIRARFPELAIFKEAMLAVSKPSIDVLSEWLRSAGLSGQPLVDALSELKSLLFENLKRSEIKDDAEQLVIYVDQYDFGS